MSIKDNVEASLLKEVKQHNLIGAINNIVLYSITTGGKRLRPLIAIAIVKDSRLPVSDEIYETVAALEFLHLASLIHDDLPALDNDDERRGYPTCHRKFGEADALLAADLMIGIGFSCAAKHKQAGKLGGFLSRAWIELCEGQFLDVTGQGVDENAVRLINAKKTGALFRASFEFGSMLAEIDNPAVFEDMRVLGAKVGLAFQIQDDALDCEGAEDLRQELFSKCQEIVRRILEELQQGGLEETISIAKIIFAPTLAWAQKL